jgi:hypothetical protein
MHKRGHSLLAIICALGISISAATVQSSTGALAGVVRDPAGAVISGAQVSLRNDGTGHTLTAATDDEGRFRFENLPAGSYTLDIRQSGFKTSERKVVIESRAVTIEIRMEIEATRAEIDVGAKGEMAGNADPAYRSLRDGEGLETYTVTNLTFKRDAGAFNLRSGRIGFLAPVEGRVVKAIFTGDGEFTLTPAIAIERNHLRMVTEKEILVEQFQKAAFCFTDQTYQEIKRQAQAGADSAGIKDALKEFNERARTRSLGQNIDARLLADIYNPKRPGQFHAFIYGKVNNDLRFQVSPGGAITGLGPEEVVLFNLDFGGDRSGIWYMGHLENEYRDGTASSEEEKRIIDAEHYRIETVIDRGEKLTAAAEFTFSALADGDRLISFGLLPSLRVSGVVLDDKSLNYIQEKRREDGSFYVVLPEPMVKGKKYKLKIDYQGDRVIQDAGGGNFAVGARTSWYPSVNAFNDRATFDLTFKVPKQYSLVGVGKLVKEWREGEFAAAQWVSEVPLAVAGFNYGLFKKKAVRDEPTKYDIEGYATQELPEYMRGGGAALNLPGAEEGMTGAITPSRLTDRALVEAQNSMRIFSKYFGEAPYGRIAITQQPQFSFGQSWPTLVYLPISAFLDSTQRWALLGGINSGLTEFIQELTPHEVAHQWWGHIVGWASYRDQWLSEGFADFSAGLYLELTERKPDRFLKYWERQREGVLEKNRFGRSANDAGPIWMGQRLNTRRTPGAYAGVVYRKGGYVLYMLRAMMWDNKTGDQRFIEMMRDFVKTYFHRNASTEGFKRAVEKHMTPKMDLDGNNRMDWFFNQWVYGTEIPRYKFDYTLTEAEGGVILKGTLAQSNVPENFKMLVPIYVDINGRIMRLGEMAITGSATRDFEVKLPQKPKRVMINANNDILTLDPPARQK